MGSETLYDRVMGRVRRFFYGKVSLKLACWLPKRVAMWAFIRVHGLSGDCPGEDYSKAYTVALDKWFNGNEFSQ